MNYKLEMILKEYTSFQHSIEAGTKTGIKME